MRAHSDEQIALQNVAPQNSTAGGEPMAGGAAEGAAGVAHPARAYDLFLTAALADGCKLWDLRSPAACPASIAPAADRASGPRPRAAKPPPEGSWNEV